MVLDVDETLIHATEKPLDYPADFMVAQYHIYRRPHLNSFLDLCFTHFDVGIWSSASDTYVSAVVSNIISTPENLKFVWGRSKVSLRRTITSELDWDLYYNNHNNYRKPLRKLKKLGWSLERILIVDDSPEKCVQNYGNAIYPSPFEGNPDDNELEFLGLYLQKLKAVKNVRAIEKRTWRQQITNSN